jgi:hypothetical protein
MKGHFSGTDGMEKEYIIGQMERNTKVIFTMISKRDMGVSTFLMENDSRYYTLTRY